MTEQQRRASFGLYVRATLFWIPLAISTVIYGVLVLAAVILPLPWRYRLVRQWNAFNIWCLRWICGVRYRVYGRENIPAAAAVVLAKHQSTWETFALNTIFPKPLTWVLKRELLRIPFFGWGMAMINPIAIDRAAGRNALEQVVQQGTDRLQHDFNVVIFPEGTRVAVGEHRRYKLGGAQLAAASGAPVVPVAHNAGLFWPRHSFIKWPGEISVHIGPVISSQGKTAEQINQQAEAWIEAKVVELCGSQTAG